MPSYYLSEDLARFGEISRAAPELWEPYRAWYAATMEAGVLDARTKRLIGLAVAYAIQEPYCIDSYTTACTAAGVTPEEMAEAVHVAAAIKGGGVLAHWAQSQNTLARQK